jgi:hypothetical protein
MGNHGKFVSLTQIFDVSLDRVISVWDDVDKKSYKLSTRYQSWTVKDLDQSTDCVDKTNHHINQLEIDTEMLLECNED